MSDQDSDTPSIFPPSLINKLSRESDSVYACLSTSDLRAATTTTRNYAQRRLLATTPRVLSTLEDCLSSTDPKIRLSSASKLADLSPATRVDLASTLVPPTDSLPASAISALLSGLRPFLDAALAASPPKEPTPQGDSMKPAPDASSENIGPFTRSDLPLPPESIQFTAVGPLTVSNPPKKTRSTKKSPRD